MMYSNVITQNTVDRREHNYALDLYPKHTKEMRTNSPNYTQTCSDITSLKSVK